jgi:hypothetical protein
LSIIPKSAKLAHSQGEIFEKSVKETSSIDEDPDDELLYALAAMLGDKPTSSEALKDMEQEEWCILMQAEYDTLRRKDVFEGPMDAPEGANIVCSHWVLKKKRDKQNVVRKLKSHIVAGGDSQVYGVDYTKTLSPTIQLSTLCYLLAFANARGYTLESLNFKNAYLNSGLDEDIYMRQPPGFEVPSKEHQVLCLCKALYSLKQAGRQWYLTLYDLLVNQLGFTRCVNDHAVFYIFKGSLVLVLGIHVNNCIIISSGQRKTNALIKAISQRYAITCLGPMRWFVALEIQRNLTAKTITIRQAAYINTITDQFNLTGTLPLSTPANPHANLFIKVTDANCQSMQAKPYTCLIGSLMYAAIATHLDIMFIVSTLARFMANPAVVHWTVARHVICYLIGTHNHALTFGVDPGAGLIGYTEADWASQPHRYSITGWTYLYNGAAIS